MFTNVRKHQVAVRMGSRNFRLEISSDTTSAKLIAKCLKHCKINPELASSYAVFENISGVETQLNSSQIVQASSPGVQFTIRKFKRDTVQARKVKDIRQQAYKKLKELREEGERSVKVVDDSEKQSYMRIILRNEQELERQIKRLEELEAAAGMKPLERVDSQEQLAETLKNAGFVQFLYCRLKKQASGSDVGYFSSDYERLLDSCGNSQADEDEDFARVRYEALV